MTVSQTPRADMLFAWCWRNAGMVVTILFGTPFLVGFGLGWLLRGLT